MLPGNNRDTAETLRNAGIESIASLDNTDQFSEHVLHFLNQINERTGKNIASDSAVIEFSRSVSVKLLVQLLTEMAYFHENLGTEAASYF